MINETQDLNYYAWCHELKRDVSAAEIWNLLYLENSIVGTLTFVCIDKNCRAHMILQNCQSYMSSTQAQFRLYPKSKHHHACFYMESQKKIKKRMPTLKIRPHPIRISAYI